MDSSEYSAGEQKQKLPLKICGARPSSLIVGKDTDDMKKKRTRIGSSSSYKPRLLQTAPIIYDSPLSAEEDTPNIKKQRMNFDQGGLSYFGLGNETHHTDPVYPGSEVWRLKGITENGLEALCLAGHGIHTVKDLRRLIAMNPDALRKILGGWVTEENLDRIVSHAMSCVLDEAEYYIFHSQAQGAFLLFNSVYDLIKVSLDGVTSVNSDQLTPNQKALLEDLKSQAYKNINDFVAVDRWAFPELLSCPQDAGCSTEFVDQGQRFPESFFEGFDVFFTYRRGDICSEFISHLRAVLSRRGICVYDENFDEVRTQVQSVPKCRVFIILLTRNYVFSNLADIIEQKRIKDHVVFPVFYGLTPSDLISKIESYTRFFLCDKTKMWWAALKETAKMPGYILANKTESELIDEIVIYISKVLYSNDKTRNMIGMDMQVEEILSLLCIESPDVRSLGIWGMVGIGKTTIAEEIFRRISIHYETCIFLKDLHEEIELKGHDAVKEQFFSRILELEPHVLQTLNIKTSFWRSRLQHKKVLIILDDVNDYRDVETFLGKLNYCGPGSRIIMTSRNRRVFVLCKIDRVYDVKPLDISESLLLLERGTSQSILLPGPNRTLSLELVEFSNGNLQVLQFLSSSDTEWNTLSREVQKTSSIYIPGIFERSCRGLDDNEKSIFLDIACFFRRMDKDKVAMLLDGCGFSAHVGFRSLVDKSLLTISHNMVDMPRFIQATGREIVRQESADKPGDRSRLWSTKDIIDVFVDDTGTSAIEDICLDMLNVNFDANPNVFEKMCNLRLLKFYYSEVTENRGVSLPQGLDYLPSKLRLLHWENYPLRSLPRCFDPKNLVELNLSSSCATKLWKGKKSLEKLKRMILSYSYQLSKIPRLSSAPNLELLDLEGCTSLVSISQSICCLKKLVSLNLKECLNLESIPSMVDLESLEVLNLSGCSKLENFPEISPNVKEIYMGGTMIQEIPSSIKNLVLLKKLDLENNKHLKKFPSSICKLKHLETLNLSGCTSLERFPDLSRRMKCLRFLDLSKTAIQELPSSISYLTALKELRFVDCKNLVKLPYEIVTSSHFDKGVVREEEDSVDRKGKGMATGLVDMPCVFTKGEGPNGRRVDGILYKYGKGEEVRIICICHGSFLTPAEFVKHGGGGDVDRPLRHIVVNTSSSSFWL